MKDDLFATVRDDHRAAAHFAARAGGRGDCDTRRQPAPVRLKFERKQWLSRSLDAEADDLAHIERAATAESDHRITVASAISRRSGVHVFDGGIGMDAGEDLPFFPRDFFQHRECVGRQQTWIGDDQRLANAQPGQLLRQIAERTGAESDFCREGEIGNHAHNFSRSPAFSTRAVLSRLRRQSTTVTDLSPMTSNAPSRAITAVASSMPTPTSSGWTRTAASSRGWRPRLTKCWSTIPSGHKPSPSAIGGTALVSRPSGLPVIIVLDITAAPALVPATTAPRANRSRIASTTSSFFSPVISWLCEPPGNQITCAAPTEAAAVL